MPEKPLSILVALHGGGLSGIDTYAEQVAAAALAAGHAVTLVALGPAAAAAVSARLPGAVRVRSTAGPGSSTVRKLARKVPTFDMGEMRTLLSSALAGAGDRYDVAHLNHPALAAAARPYAGRVVAGAWFHPHTARGRVAETWRHTGAKFPRSAAFAVKGLAHYLNDRAGYGRCDAVAAPTELLARQLRTRGIPAAACPPPAQDAGETGPGFVGDRATARLVVCCGDLAHPRKNVEAAVRATSLIARRGRLVELVLVGRNASRFEPLLAAMPPSVVVHAPGLLPREEMHGLMAGADVLLLPSLYEEWGYVATEAVMAGTPVVAFPVYPFVEVLAAPLGACARDMSPGAFASAIERVLDSGVSRHAVHAAGAARYGPEVAARRFEDLWTGRAAGQDSAVAGELQVSMQ